MRLRGYVRLTHRDQNGEVLQRLEGQNIVTTWGRGWAALATSNDQTSADYPSDLAVGDGSAYPDVSDTDLESEHGSIARVGLSIGVSGNELTYSCTVTNSTGSAKTINELGIFTASSGGNMFARWLSERFSLDDGESIDVTWMLPFGE